MNYNNLNHYLLLFLLLLLLSCNNKQAKQNEENNIYKPQSTLSYSHNSNKVEINNDSSNLYIASVDTMYKSENFHRFALHDDTVFMALNSNKIISVVEGVVDTISSFKHIDLISDLHVNGNYIVVTTGPLEIPDTTYLIDRKNLGLINKVPNFQLKGNVVLPVFQPAFILVDTLQLLVNSIKKKDDGSSTFYHYIYDGINDSITHEFCEGHRIKYHNNKFYLYLVSAINHSKPTKVKVIDSDYSLKRKYEVERIRYFEFIAFMEESYFAINKDTLYEISNNGQILKKWQVPLSYYKIIQRKDDKLFFYGWLNTDSLEREEYYFIRSVIDINN